MHVYGELIYNNKENIVTTLSCPNFAIYTKRHDKTFTEMAHHVQVLQFIAKKSSDETFTRQIECDPGNKVNKSVWRCELQCVDFHWIDPNLNPNWEFNKRTISNAPPKVDENIVGP